MFITARSASIFETFEFSEQFSEIPVQPAKLVDHNVRTYWEICSNKKVESMIMWLCEAFYKFY